MPLTDRKRAIYVDLFFPCFAVNGNRRSMWQFTDMALVSGVGCADLNVPPLKCVNITQNICLYKNSYISLR